MKIATWNINGIKARIDAATTWLRAASPDIACLQEIKCMDEAFPVGAFEDLGYNVAVHGQKGFNGLALLSKMPLDESAQGLPGDPDDVQARYIEGVISIPSGALRVVNIYLPNGNGSPEKFAYKLAWMSRLKERVKELLTYEEPFVIAGDYNVIPEPEDCYDPKAWEKDALFQPESRAAFRRLVNLGYVDAFRAQFLIISVLAAVFVLLLNLSGRLWEPAWAPWVIKSGRPNWPNCRRAPPLASPD